MSRNTPKVISIIGLSILLLCIVIALIFAWPIMTAGSSVKKEIAQIKATGSPTCRGDLEIKINPGCVNAASIYEEAFRIIPNRSESSEFKSLVHLLQPKDGLNDSKLLLEAKSIIKKYEGVFPLIDRANRASYCRFPVKWNDSEDLALLDTNSCSEMLNLATLTAARAIINASAGSMDESASDIASILNLTNNSDQMPTLIPFLTRISLAKICVDSIYASLKYGKFSQTQTQHLLELMTKCDLQSGYVYALKTERALGINLYDDFGKVLTSTAQNKSGKAPKANPLTGIMLHPDEMLYLDLMEKEIKSAKLPYRETKRRGLLKDANLPGYAFMTSFLAPMMSRTRCTRDSGIAAIDAATILLHLQTFKQKYDRYPVNLNELKSKLGCNLPKDIFSGKDFVYKPNGNGFILYTIGEDLKDNGGKRINYNDKAPRKGDHTWRLNH